MRELVVPVSSGVSVLKRTIEKESNDSKTVNKPKEFIFCCDVSYSMCDDLSDMRRHLKNEIPKILNEGDSLSIVWFSGVGQSGLLAESIKVDDLTTLKKAQDLIDKYLRPVGLTSFNSPLETVLAHVKGNSDKDYALIFLTDGYHNSGSIEKVKSTLESLSSHLSASVFIEYGYYADTNLLNEMAEITSGTVIKSVDFEAFEIEFTSTLTENSVNLIEVDISDIKSSLRYQIYSYITDMGIVRTFSCRGKSKVLIPESISEVIFYVNAKNGKEIQCDKDTSIQATIAMINQGKIDVAEEILMNTRCKYSINKFVNSYGKQNLYDFLTELESGEKFGSEGFITGDVKISKNQFCIMDVIEELVSEDGNLIYPLHPSFSYKRMSRKRNQLGTDALNKLDSIESHSEVIEEAKEKVADSMAKFVPNEKNPGVKVNSLVFNSDRANVSLLTKFDGVVVAKYKGENQAIPSYIHRNFNIIKDGILNFTSIPVKLTDKSLKYFKKNGLSLTELEDGIVLLDLSGIPTINRGRLQKVSGKEMARYEVSSLELKAERKVLDFFIKMKNNSSDNVSKEVDANYEAFLKEIGIQRDGSFSPKTEKSEVTDVYMAPHFLTKISKFSSLPSIDSILKKLSEGKSLTVSDELINSYIKKHEDSTYSELVDSLGKVKALVKNIDLSTSVNKLSLILSRKGFSDTDSYSFSHEGYEVNFVHEMKEIKI